MARTVLVLRYIGRKVVTIALQLCIQVIETAVLRIELVLDGVATSRQSRLVLLRQILEGLQLGNGRVGSVLQGLDILDLFVDDGLDSPLELRLFIGVRGLAQLLDPVDDVHCAMASAYELNEDGTSRHTVV